jgi:hypothetical protein
MQRVAEAVSECGLSSATMTHIERRLERFIANSRIVVPVIWKLFLEQVLTAFRGQHLHFVLDNTPFRDELTIVYLGLLVHSRVLPVAWAGMPAQTKWVEGDCADRETTARFCACASVWNQVYPDCGSWPNGDAARQVTITLCGIPEGFATFLSLASA